MAISATLTLTPTTVLINQQITCFLTVSNSGGAAVNVVGAHATAIFTGNTLTAPAVALGVINLGPGSITTVPASGSISFMFNVVFFAPSTGPIGAGTGTYSVGAVVSTSDGANTSPTAATVTVNPLPLPVTEQ